MIVAFVSPGAYDDWEPGSSSSVAGSETLDPEYFAMLHPAFATRILAARDEARFRAVDEWRRNIVDPQVPLWAR